MPVTISDGSKTALATATVPAGVASGEIDQYLYVSLATPVTLPAGTHPIGWYVKNINDSFQRYATITPAPGISYGESRFIYGSAIADPNSSGSIGACFGPNFPFVPEPSTWALLGGGAGGLGLVALRRQRRCA